MHFAKAHGVAMPRRAMSPKGPHYRLCDPTDGCCRSPLACLHVQHLWCVRPVELLGEGSKHCRYAARLHRRCFLAPASLASSAVGASLPEASPDAPYSCMCATHALTHARTQPTNQPTSHPASQPASQPASHPSLRFVPCGCHCILQPS